MPEFLGDTFLAQVPLKHVAAVSSEIETVAPGPAGGSKKEWQK